MTTTYLHISNQYTIKSGDFYFYFEIPVFLLFLIFTINPNQDLTLSNLDLFKSMDMLEVNIYLYKELDWVNH